ncbi:type IV toxin-antitoxin system AbiEi family antitoxin domain-containing protein [Acidobacteria bacterium AH-259-D05]|nr:type IV toxin-antitoxin system AbiEi family antitoxin domain-containing protein [Acidobacteria bacterium AH-259-D05]
MKRNSYSAVIRSRIVKGNPGRIWTYSDFPSIPATATAAALSRLCKEGLIERLRKGVYHRPRTSRFGKINPDPASVAAAVLKHRGVSWKCSGISTYNALGLTAQLSPVTVFDVERGTRSLKVGGLEDRIRIRVVPNVRGLSSEERGILDALRDLRWIPDVSPSDALAKIIETFRSGEISLDRVVKVAQDEPPRVRALLGVIGETIDAKPQLLDSLRKSLNLTTRFKVGLSEDFPAAKSWKVA